MAVKTILQLGDPRLREVALPVADPAAPEIAALVADLADTLAHWHVTSGLVQGDLPLQAVFEGIAMAVVMAIVGAAYPALRFARLAPVEALREG